MKKVTSITLGGIVFAVEVDAYQMLSSYLNAVERSFKASDDYVEIAADIESAIADKFRERKRNEHTAVTENDVEEVIAQMGHVDDLTAEEMGAGDKDANTEGEEAHDAAETKKRLYRDTDDVIIAGVASGIARYFGIDPVIVRLLFVVSIFLNGIGILAYVVLWLIVPAAKTTTQKYEMRGEGVTIADISERVKKNLHTIDERDVARAKGAWSEVRNFLHNIFLLLGKLVRVIIHIARYVLGFGLILAGALGIAGMISAGSAIWFHDGMRALTDGLIDGASGFILVSALLAVCIIPLLVLILTGSCLLLGRNIFTLTKTLTLGIVWVIAVSLAGSFGMLHGPMIAERIQNIDRTTLERYELWDGFSEIGPTDETTNGDQAVIDGFMHALEAEVLTELGQPIEGYEPSMFLSVFPGLLESDFDGVEVQIGHYEYGDDTLTHVVPDGRMMHSAAAALSEDGYRTLFYNVTNRLKIEEEDDALMVIFAALEAE